jgi:ABC-type antimicrobial peptide transport system permease subunit
MTKRFALGFAIALLLFIVINLTSAHLASDCGLMAVFGRDACADDIARAGWPLRFYEEGGFDYRNEFRSTSLVLDLLIGLLFAGTIGWLAARRIK